MSSPASSQDVLWYSREKDATWLAAQLRTARLTILQGQFGSGKSTLLRWGVLSRLRRRATDPAAVATAESRLPEEQPKPQSAGQGAGADGGRRVVIPFPDRRRASRSGASRDVEVVVYVDTWTESPLESLHFALHQALGVKPPPTTESSPRLIDMLATWQRQRGVRFLFVLDDFDECLKASTHNAAAREFVDQWVQAVSHRSGSAHFLVALSLPAEPLWELLSTHLSLLGELKDHRLQLAGISLAAPAVPPAFAASTSDEAGDAASEPAVEDTTRPPRPQHGPRAVPARASVAAPVAPPVPAPVARPVASAPAASTAPSLAPSLAPPLESSTAGSAASSITARVSAPVAATAAPARPAGRPNEVRQPAPATRPGAAMTGSTAAREVAADEASTDFDLAALSASIHAAVLLAEPTGPSPRRIDPGAIVPANQRGIRPRRRPRSDTGSRVMAIVLSVAGVLLVAGIAFVAWDGSSGLSSRRVGTTSTSTPATTDGAGGAAPPVASTLPTPPYELVADAGDSSDDYIVSDLAMLLEPKGAAAPTIRFPFGWSAEITALGEQPRVALVTNDVLQAARRVPNGPPLQVVTPLFREEVYLIVRADSPLRYIHQIRGARINIGPARGARSLTINGIYEKMFGRSIPVVQANAASREEAIEQLAAGRSVDVVALVSAQPDPWLRRLPAQIRRNLRVLEFDPDNAVSRRAAASYAPTRVGNDVGSGLEPSSGTYTLSTMTFLVSGDVGAPGANDRQITEAANAICRNLPELKASGHPKWRDVRPGAAVDTGWPNSPAAAKAFADCGLR